MTIDSSTLNFIKEHIDDDPVRLLLTKDKWPDIDMELAVNTIEGRRRIRKKLPLWYECVSLVYPTRLCTEQCSSIWTAQRKAAIIKRILGKSDGTIADLTGGLGVDSTSFASVAGKVIYNEMNERLAAAAKHNFKTLGIDNIEVSCKEVKPGQLKDIQGIEKADLIYLDPARRDSAGKKVFLLEECTPDILNLKDELLDACPELLVKLSPMADITMAIERLGNVKEIHVNAFEGECKELLLRIRKGETDEPSLTIYDSGEEMTFAHSTEKQAAASYFNDEGEILNQEGYLFEPGKALSKAGLFNTISERFSLTKAGPSAHLYFCETIVPQLIPFGKYFKIKSIEHFSKKAATTIGKQFPRCEVSARNLPISSETLRSKMKVTSGGSVHIFAFGAGFGHGNREDFIAVTERMTTPQLI